MSATSSTLTVSGSLVSAAGGTDSYAPPALVNSNAVAQSYQLALTATPLLVTLPANSQWWGLTPPPGNLVAISHKWITGDTGGKVHPTYGIPCLAVDPSNLTFYLYSATAVTVTLWSA